MRGSGQLLAWWTMDWKEKGEMSRVLCVRQATEDLIAQGAGLSMHTVSLPDSDPEVPLQTSKNGRVVVMTPGCSVPSNPEFALGFVSREAAAHLCHRTTDLAVTWSTRTPYGLEPTGHHDGESTVRLKRQLPRWKSGHCRAGGWGTKDVAKLNEWCIVTTRQRYDHH